MLDFLKENYLVILVVLALLIGVTTWYKYPAIKALKKAKASKSSHTSSASSPSSASSTK